MTNLPSGASSFEEQGAQARRLQEQKQALNRLNQFHIIVDGEEVGWQLHPKLLNTFTLNSRLALSTKTANEVSKLFEQAVGIEGLHFGTADSESTPGASRVIVSNDAILVSPKPPLDKPMIVTSVLSVKQEATKSKVRDTLAKVKKFLEIEEQQKSIQDYTLKIKVLNELKDFIVSKNKENIFDNEFKKVSEVIEALSAIMTNKVRSKANDTLRTIGEFLQVNPQQKPIQNYNDALKELNELKNFIVSQNKENTLENELKRVAEVIEAVRTIITNRVRSRANNILQKIEDFLQADPQQKPIQNYNDMLKELNKLKDFIVSQNEENIFDNELERVTEVIENVSTITQNKIKTKVNDTLQNFEKFLQVNPQQKSVQSYAIMASDMLKELGESMNIVRSQNMTGILDGSELQKMLAASIEIKTILQNKIEIQVNYAIEEFKELSKVMEQTSIKNCVYMLKELRELKNLIISHNEEAFFERKLQTITSAIQSLDKEITPKIQSKVNNVLENFERFSKYEEQKKSFQDCVDISKELIELKNHIVSQKKESVLANELQKVTNSIMQLDEPMTAKMKSKVNDAKQNLEKFYDNLLLNDILREDGAKPKWEQHEKYPQVYVVRGLSEENAIKVRGLGNVKVGGEVFRYDSSTKGGFVVHVNKDVILPLINQKNYADLHNELSELKKYLVSENKIGSPEFAYVNQALRSLHEHFSKQYPNERLCIGEDNQHFTIDESSFIRQSVVEQTRARSGFDNIPDFIERAPQSVKKFLENPKEFKITDKNFQELLEFSQEFAMPILKDKCDRFLLSNITNESTKEMLFEYYKIAENFALPQTMAIILRVSTDKFPEHGQTQIRFAKKYPPKFESIPQFDMVERVLSTRIGTDYTLNNGNDSLYVDSRKLRIHPFFKDLLPGDKAVAIVEPKMSTKALKYLIEYVYYGSIQNIDIKELAELYSMSFNNPNLADLKEYLRKILDKAHLVQIGTCIKNLHIKNDAEIIKVLLQKIANDTGTSLTLEGDGIHLSLRNPIDQDKIKILELLTEILTGLINKLTIKHGLFIGDILKNFAKLESLNLDYSSSPDIDLSAVANILARTPNIGHLHITFKNPHNIVEEAQNPVQLQNLESLSFSGGYHPKCTALFHKDTLENLKELKIPDISDTEVLLDYLEKTTNLERLEVHASRDIMRALSSQDLSIEKLTVGGTKPQRELPGHDVLSYVNSNENLREFVIDKNWIQQEQKSLRAYLESQKLLEGRREQEVL